MKLFDCARLTKDFNQKALFPLKILFFVNASSILVLYPYLTIHMRELGINVEETAIMSAITPIVIMIMPPLAGMVADKIGNFKVVLAFLKAVTGLISLLLLLVPVGRVTIEYPTRVEMTVGTPSDDVVTSMLEVDVSEHPCSVLHPYAYDVEARIETCGFVCHWSPENDGNSSTRLDDISSYAVKKRSVVQSATEVFRYPLGAHDRPTPMNQSYPGMLWNLTNNERFKTALRRISPTKLFFPTDGMYDFVCKSVDNSTTHCVFGYNETSYEDLVSSRNPSSVFRARLVPLTGNITVNDTVTRFGVARLSSEDANRGTTIDTKITFVDNFDNINEEISIELLFHRHGIKGELDPIGSSLQLDQCYSRCLFTAPRAQMCSNAKDVVEINPSLTFWSYIVVRVLIGILGGTAYAMFEGAAIALLREHKADYGLQKIYGTLGGMISSPLSGVLIDYASRGKDYTDFRPAFYLYAVLKVISGFMMLCINLEFKVPASNLMKDVADVLKNVEIITVFVVAFLLGGAWGYIENFLFWLLQDLGGSSSLMGITVTVGGIAGIPLLIFSGPIINKIGHANVLFLGFICYTIRLLGYSLIYNPWLCLIFESIEGVTTSLAFTALITYTASLSTSTTDSSIQGLVGGLYYGVGRGAGTLMGGYLMKSVGTRKTYQIFAIIMLFTGIAYICVNKFYIRKNCPKATNDICKKEPSTKDLDKVEKSKPANEKMPLKDSKLGVNMYLENVCKNNNEAYENEKNKKIISKENSTPNGIDNPNFEDSENINYKNIIKNTSNNQ